jgi:hypothetical protein
MRSMLSLYGTTGADNAGVIFSGTYTNGILLSNLTAQNPATLAAGGYVTNQGTANYGDAIAGIGQTAWDFTNLGVIKESEGIGVSLGGGSVTNGAGAVIAGGTGGIGFSTAAGTVVNYGTIYTTVYPNAGSLSAGTQSVSVYLHMGGSITNAPGGLIGRNAGDGIVATQSAAITNEGSIGSEWAGILLAGGGYIDNAERAVIIGQEDGIYLVSGGVVVNQRGALIAGPGEGQGAGILSDGSATTISNYGTIGGGIYLRQGGLVTNWQDAAFSGLTTAVAAVNAPATVVNFGFMEESGVALIAGGVVVNGGVLDSVVMSAPGIVTNLPGGGIAGVRLDAGGTVVNAGTIVGGENDYAVKFGGTAAGLLVLDPGAVFGNTLGSGALIGNGADTIELAFGTGTGTLAGLGSQTITGFDAITVDADASWQLSGDAGGVAFTNDGSIVVGDSLVLGAVGEDPGASGIIDIGSGGVGEFTEAVGAGQEVVFTAAGATIVLDDSAGFAATISGFMAGDTIDLAGEKADHVVFANGQLQIMEGSTTVATLLLSGKFKSREFHLAKDSNGGTDITLKASAGDSEFAWAAPTALAAFWVRSA